MTESAAAKKVTAAKATAVKALAGEKKAIRRDAYSNDNWNKRRKLIFISLGFIGVCVAYLVFLAPDDVLRQNLAYALTGAGVSIIGSYAFAATWDDNNKRSTLAQTDVAMVEAEVAAEAEEV
ncbi:MAG: hypothetical protein Q8P46_15015 [Hyphomicrobiales bacterium]|nr:hypothetical protein [Hyphomicrobiales bacterium]